MAKGGRESAECDIDMQRPMVIHLHCGSPLLWFVAPSGVPAPPRMCVRNVKTHKQVWARPIQRHSRVSGACRWTFGILHILTRASSSSSLRSRWAFAEKYINCCQCGLLTFRGTLSACQPSSGVRRLPGGFQELHYLSPSQNSFQMARTHCQIS